MDNKTQFYQLKTASLNNKLVVNLNALPSIKEDYSASRILSNMIFRS